MWSYSLSIKKIFLAKVDESDPRTVVIEIDPSIDFDMMKVVSLESIDANEKEMYFNFTPLFKSTSNELGLSLLETISAARTNKSIKLRFPQEMKGCKIKFFHIGNATVSKTLQL